MEFSSPNLGPSKRYLQLLAEWNGHKSYSTSLPVQCVFSRLKLELLRQPEVFFASTPSHCTTYKYTCMCVAERCRSVFVLRPGSFAQPETGRVAVNQQSAGVAAQATETLKGTSSYYKICFTGLFASCTSTAWAWKNSNSNEWVSHRFRGRMPRKSTALSAKYIFGAAVQWLTACKWLNDARPCNLQEP